MSAANRAYPVETHYERDEVQVFTIHFKLMPTNMMTIDELLTQSLKDVCNSAYMYVRVPWEKLNENGHNRTMAKIKTELHVHVDVYSETSSYGSIGKAAPTTCKHNKCNLLTRVLAPEIRERDQL